MSMFCNLIFYLIRWNYSCDKKNPAFVDFYNKILFVLKNVIKLAKGSLNNNFQDSFNKISSQQLTHDKSNMCKSFYNAGYIESVTS